MYVILNKEIKRNIEQILNDPDMDIEFMTNYIDSGLLMNHIRKLKRRLINYNQKQEQLKDINSPNVKRFFVYMVFDYCDLKSLNKFRYITQTIYGG